MLTQFQKEFWTRFTIPLTRLDSIGIQRVRSRIPANHNPFHYYDKAIISIDTLKQDAEYRTWLEQAYWDVIVIDEAHNVVDRGGGSGRGNASHGRTSLCSRLARLLARRSDTLIMFSATPHDGRARSFASLMNMLDETAIADPDDLAQDLHLASNQVEILHGGLGDVDRQRVVEDFGNAARPLRLLICSDVASEGINLHYQCHRLIHFDMPWSLMVFQQRNGRVDRYGQERTPHIVYLVAESANPTIRGDTRILEVLADKDEQAHRNIGDPSAFMRVYDVEDEEEVTRNAIAAGEQAARFDARLTPASSEGDDLLELFLGTKPPENDLPDEPREPPPAPVLLFESEIAYCQTALHRLREKDRALRFETDVTDRVLSLDAPDDLRRRFGYFPREVFPENGRFALTTDRTRMRDAIAGSRRDETAWPAVHYLWRLNPVVGWLNDRVLAAFGRHEAPVLAGVPNLAADETAFVLSGLVPNRRSHPLLYEWLAVTYRGARHETVVPLEALLDRTGLGRGGIANRGLQADVDALRRLLPDAVAKAREWVAARRRDFEERVNEKLNRELEALEKLKARRLRQLELQLERSDQSETFKRARADRGRRDVETIFDEYLK